LKNQKFGIEIEMTGLTRKRASEIIAMYFQGQSIYIGGPYSQYSVKDSLNRKWKIVYDGSITPEGMDGYNNRDAYKVEVVSPICQYSDIEDIQKIVRRI